MFFIVFSLIKVALWLVLLPFKILWEIAEHSGHGRRSQRRRPAPARRSAPPVRPRTLSAGPPQQARPLHWQSLSRGRKALIIGLPVSLVLLVAIGAAMGSPGPAGPSGQAVSPTTQAASAGAAQAAGVASVPATSPAPTTHPHHRRHHHRRHHHAVTPPMPAPTPAGCYPIASSGNCYEPGEFCPHADAGMSGVAGDGEQIVCEDNNGLRWEPV